MAKTQLVKHAPGAPGLRWFGLGPWLIPNQGLYKLQKLLNNHAFWAENRRANDLKKMLAGSTVIVTIWHGQKLVGFGRATSDGIYRAVLWDVVVDENLQGLGLGRRVVEALLQAKSIKAVERIYLMTTKSGEFYKQMKFLSCVSQQLLIKEKEHKES